MTLINKIRWAGKISSMLICGSCFVYFAAYSYKETHPVIAQVEHPAKPVILWREPTFKERQAMALAEVYGLTADDAMKPINIWGNHASR